jgi:hypothetical protein
MVKKNAPIDTQTAQKAKIKFRFRAESACKLSDGIYFYECGVWMVLVEKLIM